MSTAPIEIGEYLAAGRVRRAEAVAKTLATVAKDYADLVHVRAVTRKTAE